MKKYEAYKDSGVEWIGEIPEGWETKKIKTLANTNVENSFVDGDWIESPVIEDSGIRYITSGNVGKGSFKRQGNGYISAKTFAELKCKYAYPGDLIFSRLNAPYGRSCILPEDYPEYVIAVDNVILRTNHNKAYICYVTQCSRYEEAVEMIARGTAMKRVSRTKLGDIILPIPPIIEQQSIASYLDHKVGQIDASVSAINTQIEDLKAYRMSIISEVVTRGLNPDAKMKDSGIEWIGKIPEGWETPKLKWMVNLKSGTSLTSESILDNGKYVVYGGNGPRGYYNEYTNEGHYVLIGRQGALCGNINYAQGKFWATEHAVVCYPKVDMAVIWLGEMLRAMNLNQYSVSAAQPGLAVERISELRIPLPPLSEQQAIADYLDKKTSEIDSAISSLEAQRDDLNALKQSIISEAVTGKIDLRDWNSDK